LLLDIGSLFAFDPNSLIEALVLLLSIFDAIGTAPLFLGLTEDYADQRGQIARKSILMATISLLVFACLGLFIFQFMGFTIDDFKIDGGIILSNRIR